jgi:hypothetical protein
VREHWTRQYSLDVIVFMSADSATVWLMSVRSASSSAYENAFLEALADPVWVAAHARIAREAMCAEVRDAAFRMEIAWKTAIEISGTRQYERCAATSKHAFMN